MALITSDYGMMRLVSTGVLFVDPPGARNPSPEGLWDIMMMMMMMMMMMALLCLFNRTPLLTHYFLAHGTRSCWSSAACTRSRHKTLSAFAMVPTKREVKLCVDGSRGEEGRRKREVQGRGLCAGAPAVR